jgi:hypothetical protein
MNFKDAQLQRCYDSNLLGSDDSSSDCDSVRALIVTHDLFLMLEGAHSPRVHEVLAALLLPESRTELRRWYQRHGAQIDAAAVELREQLSQLAGEKLEQTDNLSRERESSPLN